MKSVAFHTLGCKVNQYETEAITEQFLKSGYNIVEFDEIADIYVVNTCTVTNIADKKSRKMLSKAKKMNGEAVVVAVGCYVQVAHDALDEVPFVDVLIGNTHKDQVVQVVENYLLDHKKEELIENVHEDIIYEELTIAMQHNKTRSTIKIQDGCNQYCTYCIIPYTRGKIRSRKSASVIDEVTTLAEKGYKEIILTGIHLGSYGKDLEDISLIGLIEELQKIQGLKRIRLGSLEPNFITEQLLVRLKACDKVCDHFHLSMQSGSDSVLGRMKRHYNSEKYDEKVRLLRSYYNNPAITTDVIVGFPMETEIEEEETYQFVKKIAFADLHVFKYSIREGTKAAVMKPQVDGKVKSERSKRLTLLGDESRTDYMKSFIGTNKEIILEETHPVEGEEYFTGYTTNYIKIYLKAENFANNQVGDMVTVMLSEVFEDGLKGC